MNESMNECHDETELKILTLRCSGVDALHSQYREIHRQLRHSSPTEKIANLTILNHSHIPTIPTHVAPSVVNTRNCILQCAAYHDRVGNQYN